MHSSLVLYIFVCVCVCKPRPLCAVNSLSGTLVMLCGECPLSFLLLFLTLALSPSLSYSFSVCLHLCLILPPLPWRRLAKLIFVLTISFMCRHLAWRLIKLQFQAPTTPNYTILPYSATAPYHFNTRFDLCPSLSLSQSLF